MDEIISSVTLLFVDDDNENRETMVNYFKDKSEYNILSAASGEDALKIIEFESVDLLVTDNNMPGINGLELCDIVRKKYNIDVIIMTGYVDDISYERAISKGAIDIVAKPFRLDEFLIRIKKAINDRLLTIERIKMLKKMQSQLLHYKNKYGANDINRIERIIEFPEEYFQAGVSILNYFGRVLRKKCPDKNARVSIEQDGLTVKMVIVTPEGQKEVIESILNEYGNVITGKADIGEFTDDKFLSIELRNELRIAQVRVESQKELIAYQNASIKSLNDILEKAIASKPSSIEVHVPITCTTQLDVNQHFEISPKLTLIQNGFEELAKYHLETSTEKEYLNKLISAARDLKKCQTKEDVVKSSAFSKIKNFLKEIQQAETVAGKVIKTTKNGIEIGRRLAGYYNEIAQWAGLPQVPTPLVKK